MNVSLPGVPGKAPEPMKTEPVSAFAIEDDDSSLLPKTVDNDPAKLKDRLEVAAERAKATSPAPASALPAAPTQRKVKLDTLELPSGVRLDPECWGIDLEFVPEVAGSTNFAMDEDDDEPVHLVEMPAELREFMNSETAKDLSPDQMKSIFVEVMREEFQKFADAQPVPVPAPPVERVVRETTHERVIERVSGTIEADRPTVPTLMFRLFLLTLFVVVVTPVSLKEGAIFLTAIYVIIGHVWLLHQGYLWMKDARHVVSRSTKRTPSSRSEVNVEHWDPELSRINR